MSQPSREHDAVAIQLVAELRSEGYVVQWFSYPAATPCAGAPGGNGDTSSSGVWIELGPAQRQGSITATICYRPALGSVEQTSVTVAQDDPRHLAIATVEALNGLRSGPRLVPASPTRTAEEITTRRTSPELPHPATFGFGAATATDPTGAGPIHGAELRLITTLGRSFAIGVEAFAPLSAAQEHGADRTLRLRAAWVRVGALWHWPVPHALMFASIHAGPALAWASSEPTAPLIGTTQLAATAFLSVGVGAVYPREGPIFSYLQAQAGRLVPEVILQTGADSTRHFGRVLLGGGFGFGVRWH